MSTRNVGVPSAREWQGGHNGYERVVARAAEKLQDMEYVRSLDPIINFLTNGRQDYPQFPLHIASFTAVVDSIKELAEEAYGGAK